MFLNDEETDQPLVNCTIVEDIELSHMLFSDVDRMISFRTVHQNIRSYKKNIDEFLVVLDSFKIKFNCIILTEAWLNDESDLVYIDGYNLFRSYNNLNNNDGVVVYIDNSLLVSCEQLCLGGVATGLSLTFDWAGLPCRLLATYRSPNSNLSLFVDAVHEYCNQPIHDRGISIFAGDINCDIINPIVGSESDRYVDTLHAAKFFPCIDKITRPASGTCIDHFFLKSNNTMEVKSLVVDTSVTDHCLICLELSKQLSRKSNIVMNQKLKHIRNWKDIKQQLTEHNWGDVMDTNDLNEAVSTFTNTLQNVLDSNTVITTLSASKSKIKPWITSGIIKSIRVRDKLHKRLRRQPFNTRLRNEYLRYRNTLHSLIKQLKFDYYKNKIDLAAGNPRKFWSTVNEIAGRPTGPGRFPVEAYCEHGDTVTPDKIKEIAQSFNSYFASVGERLAAALNPPSPSEVDDADYATISSFTLRPVSQQELLVIINSLRGRSAPGWDDIPTNFVKDNIATLIVPIMHIINLSLIKGEFPELFKIAKVIPIFKSGERSMKSNFRPISMLVTLSKILEKCVKTQLQNYLNSEQLIAHNQYGFRTKKNSSHALFDVTRNVVTEIGKQNKVLMTFLDLSKAFDTVDRTKMLRKLHLMGIQGNAYAWFVSYFNNRRQKVSIDGIDSEVTNVDFGVVQGSTLGPLLFLIYINNISKVNLRSKLFLFADDTAVVSAGCTWDEVYQLASEDLTKIKKWFDQNTLTVNISKTKYLPIFLRTNSGPGLRMLALHSCGDPGSGACDCGVVERVEKYKYLGVIFDNKFSWAPHVQYLRQRLRRLIYAFVQLGRVLNPDRCRSIYYAYVQSLLQYGILAWGGASPAVLEPLSVSQRAIIKIILQKNPRFPTALLHAEFPVLTVRKLFIKNLLLHIEFNSNDIILGVQHNYATRFGEGLGIHVPRLQSSLELTTAFFITNYLYRNLHNDYIQFESGSVALFKRSVTEWLLRLRPEAAEALIKPPFRL